MNLETASWQYAERVIDQANTPETRRALAEIDKLRGLLDDALASLENAESRLYKIADFADGLMHGDLPDDCRLGEIERICEDTDPDLHDAEHIRWRLTL